MSVLPCTPRAIAGRRSSPRRRARRRPAAGRHWPARVTTTPTRGPRRRRQMAPPPTPATAAATPSPQRAASAASERRDRRQARRRRAALRRQRARPRAAEWVAQFYKIYEIAQRTFGVNWLLIASIHKQETAFSTHPTTYRGPTAGCCAGPMRFNVTNGTRTRPRPGSATTATAPPPAGGGSYAHRTDATRGLRLRRDHGAAALLRDSGTGMRLDATAWRAAYDYYGHDLTGGLRKRWWRAIGWAQRSFINCAADERLRAAVDAAWAPRCAPRCCAQSAPGKRSGAGGMRNGADANRSGTEARNPAREMDGGRRASESNRPRADPPDTRHNCRRTSGHACPADAERFGRPASVTEEEGGSAARGDPRPRAPQEAASRCRRHRLARARGRRARAAAIRDAERRRTGRSTRR